MEIQIFNDMDKCIRIIILIKDEYVNINIGEKVIFDNCLYMINDKNYNFDDGVYQIKVNKIMEI